MSISNYGKYILGLILYFLFSSDLLKSKNSSKLTITNERKNRVLSELEKEQIQEILSKFHDMESYEQRIHFNKACYVIDEKVSVYGEDCISLGDKENGKQWIYTHIADIANYIPFESPLDEYAKDNVGSMYLRNASFTMFPQQIVSTVAFNKTSNHSFYKAITFGFLVDNRGKIHKYTIFPSSIPFKNVHQFSFHHVDIMLGDNEQNNDLVQLHEYSNLLRKERYKFNNHDSNFLLSYSYGKSSKSESQLLIRELMLYSGLIAGNIASQFNTPMIFRENFGPILSSTISTKNNHVSKKPVIVGNVITSSNPIYFSNYAPVTSPVRKYSDFFNHIQLQRKLKLNPILSEDLVSSLLGHIQATGSKIKDAQKKSSRKNTLLEISKRVGKGGELDAKIVSITKGVVSGKNNIMTTLSLLDFKNFTIPFKLHVNSDKKDLQNQYVRLIVKDIDPNRDLLDLSFKEFLYY